MAPRVATSDSKEAAGVLILIARQHRRGWTKTPGRSEELILGRRQWQRLAPLGRRQWRRLAPLGRQARPEPGISKRQSCCWSACVAGNGAAPSVWSAATCQN